MKKKANNRLIPLDIESVCERGVDRWFSEFDFPISWGEFLKIEKAVNGVLNQHISDHTKYADLIVINYKIGIEFSNYILGLLLKEKIGNKALIAENNEYYNSLFNTGIVKPNISFPDVKNHKTNLKARLRKLKRYLVDNNFSFPRFWKTPVYLFAESRSHHTLEFLQQNYPGRIIPLSFYDVYKASNEKKLSESDDRNIQFIAASIKNGIVEIAAAYGININQKQHDFIYHHILDLFRKTQCTLLAVKKGIGNRKIQLFIGSNNNYYSRIMSVAIREAAGKIHGFKHGEPVNYLYDLVSWLDLSLNDYYYEYTEKHSNMMRKIAEKFPPPNKNNCEILSMNSLQYKDLLSDNVRKQNGKVERVMFIGNCFRHSSFSSATAVFSPLQLYIELSVIDKLKRQGFKVIYKLHPENLDKRIGFVKDISIFKNLFPSDVEINTLPFEKEMDNVDAYAFYYTATSTFGPAVKSSKQVYFYDVNLRSYPNRMQDFITQRCNLLETKLKLIK